MNRMLPRGVATGAALALALVVSGCSWHSTESESLDTSPTPTATYTNLDDWDAAWTDCLRDRGIQFSADGSPLAEGQDGDELYAEVSAQCDALIGPMPNGGLAISPEEQYAMWSAVAECLRDLGYTVEDPQLQPGGFWGFRAPVDATEADVESCSPEPPQ